MEYLEIPKELTTGDFISFVHAQMTKPEGMRLRYTFSGSVYFERMKSLSLYSTNRAEISERVAKVGLTDVYNTCLV